MDNCVSIIVPVYNAEKTIRRCIDSALQQSEENIELLLIDDGSTDLSGQICDEYALIDSRITVFHQNNTGVSGARNKGLEYARGEYITFLDADDELFPDAIHVLKDKAKSCDADMVIGRLVHCGKDGVDHVEDIDLIDDLLVGDEFLQLVLEDNPYCYSVYRILYKAPFLAGIKFEVGRIVNEDAFFVFQCALKEPKVAFVNNKVYRYIFNVHSVTKSGFSIKKYEDTLFFLNRKMEYIREIRPDYLEKMYNLFVKCHMNLLQNMCRTSGSEWHWRKKLSISEFRKYKKYFIPQTRQDRKMYFVLSHNLYNIYCILLSLRARK